jgi:hypothetical protein
MKIWFDYDSVDFTKFTSEQFLLLPFFSEDVINKDNDFKNNNWLPGIKQNIKLVNKEEADVFIYPKKFDSNVVEYVELAKHYNKKVYCFYNDDNSLPVASFDNLVLYRTSLLASKKKINEHAMPAWSQDLFVPDKAFRLKANKPTVGFCGYISHPIRNDCLNILNQNEHINKNFIIRNSFWGGAPHDSNIRKVYVDNIVNSDFVLCCRGAGNFSYRLYETLSCGRIPIIIDTDCVYPCQDKTDWSNTGIYVTDINNLNTLLNEFWSSIAEDKLIALQQNIRETYTKYIAPDGFAQYLSYNI